MNVVLNYLKHYFLFVALPGICLSISSLVLFSDVFYNVQLLGYMISIACLSIFYFLLRKKQTIETFHILCGLEIISILSIFVCFLISKGSTFHSIWIFYGSIHYPYFINSLVNFLMGDIFSIILYPLILTTLELVICYYVVKPHLSMKKTLIASACLCLTFCGDYYIFKNSPAQKYKGHDFEYMNGYSSVDLTDYLPYKDNNKLVKLPGESTFIIDNEKDMPILDGAEACYPVYAAIANAVYKDIGSIESNYKKTHSDENGKIVTFYNSSDGYSRLFHKEIDMFFGAKPSSALLEEAKDLGVELEYTPIGKEAFVFFVNKNNPISNISSVDLRKIYSGEITNWKELGGPNEDIVAFQRPENSGSQVMMRYFMGDTPLKDPVSYEMIGGMGDILHEVADYYNESGAIGYSFKYYVEGLQPEQDIKILSIDNIKPSTDNIKNGDYPLSTYLYCVTLKSNKKENVQKMKEYLLSPQGQYIIEQTGYCAL